MAELEQPTTTCCSPAAQACCGPNTCIDDRGVGHGIPTELAGTVVNERLRVRRQPPPGGGLGG
jgi:hypothetical protein